jgi:hypothetical protein
VRPQVPPAYPTALCCNVALAAVSIRQPLSARSGSRACVTGSGLTGSRVLASARGCFVAEMGLVATLPLSLSASPKRESDRRRH